VASINQYSLTIQLQQEWTSGPLSPGSHTITIRHSSGTYISVDAFAVNSATVPSEPAPEPLDNVRYVYDGDGNLVKSVTTSTLGTTVSGRIKWWGKAELNCSTRA
jgi:hypothetical protein